MICEITVTIGGSRSFVTLILAFGSDGGSGHDCSRLIYDRALNRAGDILGATAPIGDKKTTASARQK